MRRLRSLFILLAVWMTWVVPASGVGNTYYISSSAGDDTRTSTQAQSKTTPWAHLRCMANATSNAAAYTPVAGDVFILKGGDTWLNTSFPCLWSWAGTSGSRIQITVDKTWFAGGSWVRPIWTAGGTAIAGAKNEFIDFSAGGVQYVTLSNVEMTGFHWDGSPAFATCQYILAYNSTNITLDHLYIHGWTHGTLASGTADACNIILGQTTSPFASGGVLQNSVIDGSDSTGGGDSQTIGYGFPSYKNNVAHHLPNFFLPLGDAEISGNLVYSCVQGFDFPANHPNFLETLGGPTSGFTVYIHDNVFHDSAAGCEAAFLGNPGETDYVWNNVWYNLSGNPPELTQNVTPGVAVYFWNNTVVPPSGGYCLRQGHSGNYTTVEFRNNHCVTTASQVVDPAITATTLTIDHNVLQTPATASAQGYTSGQTYAYSPTDVTNSTVGVGANLTSNCSGLNIGLCSDTFYGSVVSGNDVTGAGRVMKTRPSGGAWDAGAYIFTGGPPLPPSPVPTIGGRRRN